MIDLSKFSDQEIREELFRRIRERGDNLEALIREGYIDQILDGPEVRYQVSERGRKFLIAMGDWNENSSTS